MPTIGVDIAIIQDGQVLLAQRSDFPVWCLPGGQVDDGESLAHAAIREAREETGLEVELTRLVGIYSRPHWRNGGDHDILFAASAVGGNLQQHDRETIELGFFNLDNLPDALLWWYHQRILDALSHVSGAVWLQDVTRPARGESRQELYRLRDEGLLPTEDFIREMCGAPRVDREKLEVSAIRRIG